MKKEKSISEKISVIKPSIPFNPDSIPEEMKRYNQWITWALVEDDQREKPLKIPVKIARKGKLKTPYQIKWGDPKNQMGFAEALAEYESNPDILAGVGFVFTNDDPFVFIDLDNIYPMDMNDPEKAKANDYIDKAKGTFVEFSQSSKGVHIIVEGYIPKAEKTDMVEIYKNGRFCAMTGKLTPNAVSAIKPNQALIDKILTDLDIEVGLDTYTGKGFEIPEVIKAGERNDILYRAAWHLWGKGLRDEELQEAYEEVVERCEVPIPSSDRAWQFPERVAEEQEIIDRRNRRTAESVGLVNNYAFVPELNKFFDFNSKQLYSGEAINSLHARTHPGINGVPKARTYLERHPQLIVCQGIIWMPGAHGTNNRIVKHEGFDYANTWKGFAVNPISGNVDPWLKVLNHLYPDEVERNHVIKRMAFDVQFPHLKCNWHIVNFGIQGAGKDLALYPLSRIFGSAFSSVGNQEIKSDYDDGFVKTKIVEVNEVRGLSYHSLEKVKQKCTNEGSKWMQLNPKKESKITVPNLWSLYFNTNHSDALHITPNERRFYILRCRTAMTDVFTAKEIDEIANWIKYDDYSPNYVMHYLLNVDLSDFDPGIVPERTEAFYDMVEIVQDDLDDTLNEWSDLDLHCFDFKFIRPEMIAEELRSKGVKVKNREIKVWMERNGWKRFPQQIQKKGQKPKSRSYHYKDTEYSKLNAAEIWDMIEDEESKRDLSNLVI